MPQGAITFRLVTLHFDLLNGGANVNVSADALKYITDDQGNNQNIGNFFCQLTYPVAGLTARTIGSIRQDIIAQLQAQNAALNGQTIS